MSRFLNVLRSWLVMVSIIAMGNTLQSFRDHTFLYEKLYTGKPDLGKKSENCILHGSGPKWWMPDQAVPKNKLGSLKTNTQHRCPFSSPNFLKLPSAEWGPSLFFYNFPGNSEVG